MKRTLLFTLALYAGTTIHAQNFNLVKEINTTATSTAISIIGLAASGNTVYYVASDGINGNELWKSDGTPGGTSMVKDINPGAANGITVTSTPNSGNSFVANNGILYFVANDGVSGNELWRSDGTTTGTYLLKDITPGANSSTILRMFFHNGILFFGATDGTTGFELWKSDGTEAGTALVKDINPGVAGGLSATANVYFFTALGADVYFPANNGTNGIELWKTDGTNSGTVMVKDINPGSASSIGSQKAAVFNNKIYFAATNGSAVNGTELWVSDGSDAGTSMVKDIVTGTGNSFPNNLIEFNGALFFSASSANLSNPDLWKTDGTELGTVMVKNLVADGIAIAIGNSTQISEFTISGTKLFFRIISSPSGAELYATDGTTPGSGIVSDLYPGVNGLNPSGLISLNNNVYFIGQDLVAPSKGSALYKSDGTSAGTVPVATGLTANSLGVQSNYNVIADNKLYFLGNTIDNGIELWSTDGSSAGTAIAKDVNIQKLGTPNTGINLMGSVTMNGNYYYAAADDNNGMELWKSDGTTAGTIMIKDIWQGKGSSYPSQFTAYNGTVYFVASTEVTGSELWKTDGTEAGTVMIADIAPGSLSSSINRITINNNKLFFTAYHPLYGQEFWQSDGTSGGTSLLVDLVTGAATGVQSLNKTISIGNNVYLIANVAAGNILGIPQSARLFKLDVPALALSEFFPTITAAQDIATIGNTLYITGRNGSNNTVLWKSENGGAVSQVKVLNTNLSSAYNLTNCNGKLFFNGTSAAAGMEPWVSDGTEAGTFMLKDINPGTAFSTPHEFMYSGGKVFFTASAGGSGFTEAELWATDGTTAGTYLVKDIQPGINGSRPNGTISIPGNKVLFAANDGVNGFELWQSNGTAAGTYQFPAFNSNGDGVIPSNSIFINFSNDYIYSKLNDNLVFFARSADKGIQLYGGNIAGNYLYVNDNNRTGDIFTNAIGDNTNSGSQAAPFATLSYAVSQASEGDTIYVDAGLYTEQVTIDKGITIIGAGSGATIILKPSEINPPGDFYEPGTIQSIQNIGDVHISDMSITGDNSGVTPIILQTGGSVKNCRLIYGNQGIYFRVNTAIKTVVIENNYMTVQYIGINCVGTGLTATVINNSIDLNHAGFSAGIFAGAEIGPLVRFTAFGNSINNHKAQGIYANSYNTNITQNSIVGSGQYAIQQNTNSLAFATCNWFGTSNASTVASKVSGFFSYNPFLTSGTNTNTTYGVYSFIPVAGACSEGVNNFYVNDNSRSNDVFTTAIGSNSNPGTSVAPFATLSHAISVAPVNSVIHVDAGTYAEQVIINKGIIINGAGRELTSFIPPATALVAAPGSFTEIGLFVTTQGIDDVHIRNISVNSVDGSSQNIIIQTGGSVKNCKLLNGGQGVFFRNESVSKYVAVEFNIIQPTGIAINCQGAGMTANIVNNTISKPGGYYAAIFAGLDFGPVYSLNITNNSISDYNSIGMLINSSTISNISNNRILGTGNRAIEQFAGMRLNATCNWYGTADHHVFGPKIYGNINYSPWLTDGTDNDAISLGFQPFPNVCNQSQNKFYVNDNILSGEVFTSAIGNDNNSGVPAAPLLTLNAALTRAQAGDTIFVDAGTYAASSLNITKAVTILGSNYTTSPNNPADRLVINPVRNANALITGSTFTIASNDVRIEGLTFNPGAIAQINLATTGVNNFTFKRNYSIVTGGNFLSLSGPTIPNGQAPAFGNYLIEDNRFEGQSTTNSTCIIVNAVNNVTVNNNAFITPATSTQRVLSSSISGNIGGGLTVNYVYTNNITYAARNDWFSAGNIASARIENNISLHGSRSYVLQSFIATSTDIQVRSNYIESNFSDLAPIQYQRNGSATPGALANLVIENNTIAQNATGRTLAPSGILAYNFYTGSTPSTTIRRNKISFTGNYSLLRSDSVFGINIIGGWQNINIDENEVVFSGTNLPNTIPVSGQLSSGISISSDNGVNTIPANAVVNVSGNKINGFKNSVAVFDPSGVAPNTYVGYGNLPAGVNFTINNNSFTGDVMSINNGSIGQQAQASCNWYGTAALQDIKNKVTLPTVAYTPYLINGTDNDLVTTGFQPVAGSCNNYPINVIVDSYTNVTCNGANNGTINITVSGGLAPYTFAWTKTGDPLFISTVEDPNNFGPGTYHLAITDALGTNFILDQNGNIITIEVTLTEPTILTATGSGTNVSCFNGANGTAAVVATGGTAPYSYLWSNGGTTSSITGLVAGNYTVVVTDANGCTANTNYIVTQPAVLNVTLTGTTASCNGSVNTNVTGGTAPYTYLWNNGAITPSLSNVPAGAYTVVVTDALGCTASGGFTITGNSPINPTTTLVPVNCFGEANGSITVTGAGGTAPHTYNINGSAFQASNVFNNLPAGVYIIGAKDANGCSDFVSRTILQPALLTLVLDSTRKTCPGGSTGRIYITASGGNATKTYSWTGPNGFISTAQDPNNIVAGNYSVTVTDSKGCTANLNVTLEAYPGIVITESITHVACFGEFTGAINATVTGGTGTGFTYAWSRAGGYTATTEDISGLRFGNYTLTVTDIGSGCQFPKLIVVNQSPELLLTTDKTNATGCNSLGTITASGADGTAPYLYSIDGTNYQSSGSFTGLYAGSYTVLVKDNKGCIKSKVVDITDKGDDEYEGNNTKGKSAAIIIGATINGRMAVATDVADWFKFTTPAGTNDYVLTFEHPSAAFNFILYPVGNNAPALIPNNTTATTKEYTLSGNTTYHIGITGGLSFVCYTMSVSPVVAAPRTQVTTTIVEQKNNSNDRFEVKVFGNPSDSYFAIMVVAGSKEKIKMRIIDVSGRVIEQKENLVLMQDISFGETYHKGVYFAEITQGKNKKVIKLIKL